MSLKTKFILMLSSLVITLSIVIIGVLLYFSIAQVEADSERQFKDNLIAKRSLVAKEVVDYFHIIEKQIITMAYDQSTKQAVLEFTSSFKEQSGSTASNSLLQYYQNDYKSLYDDKNEQQIDVNQLIDQLSPAAINFQNQYIADNAFSLGEKDKLDTANADNSYNRAHEKFHPTFRKFLHEFEFYDIFIVEPEQGNIVYSVYKELDYATSLINGPYKSSGIADAFNSALSLQEGEFYITDFKPYVPSYNSSASFMSTPIYNDNTLIGVLIYQMPIEDINNIMIQEGKWLESGFGDSGEIYLVGSDNTLRSDSRFFVEDKQGYLDLLKNNNIDAWKEIERKNTTIALQPVSTIASKKALSGVSDTDTFKDYRGVDVFSAFAPINVGGGLNWAIISEIDVEEAHRGAKGLSDQIVIQGIVILLISSVVSIVAAIAIANYLIRPLSELSEKVSKLSSGEADLTIVIKGSNIAEIDEISEGVNRFIKKIHILVSEIKATIDVFATSGIELGVTTEQTSININKQGHDTEQVVSAITNFSSSLDRIMQETKLAFESTENANKIANDSSEKAVSATNDMQKLSEQVQSSTHSIRELQESVEDIGNVLSVINSIADQTNLLALNAAIEAARAGEHGRGFSVVADEVRTLASKTQESTITIQSQIEGLTSATSKAVNSMESASETAGHSIEMVEFVSDSISELGSVVKQIETMNQSISGQTETQYHSIDFITKSMSSLQDGSVEISQASTNINSVAAELASVAEGLRSLTSEFKV